MSSPAAKVGSDVLLTVADLRVAYPSEAGRFDAVKGLNFSINRAETLGIVGESGSGKTQSVLALMGLLPDTAALSGSAVFGETELVGLPLKQLNEIRGKRIAMIFQDPMTALNPHLTIGDQMSLVLKTHLGLSGTAARDKCVAMLDAVKIPEARKRLDQYPHELSGGMRQRVMIATALLCEPELLIADEPTTALDVTVQAQILQLIRELQTEFQTSVLLITHDMGVVAGNCDRVLVMQSGECVEYGDAAQVFYEPQHEYTRALLKAVPRVDDPGTDLPAPEAAMARLEVSGLEVEYKVAGDSWLAAPKPLKALRGADFKLAPGETLGVVGESGCGKSTMARAVLRLLDPSAGSVVLMGNEIGSLSEHELKPYRKDMQVVFQDPLASLNPRMTVAEILTEPLKTFSPSLGKEEMNTRAQTMLKKVGLEALHMNRYPHEFSGGQCQRIGIARALMFEPKLMICDEPVSALDVSVQARIVNLLIELQRELGLSLVFIAHDLAVVRQMSHRVAVMYLGKIVELTDRDSVYEHPRHPYTKALIDAVPVPDPEIQRNSSRPLLTGDLPSPSNPPEGCAFNTRCTYATAKCRQEKPEMSEAGDSSVACHFPLP